MTLQWYALRSKPRKEETVWKQVSTHGFEVFYPRLRVKPVNPRASKIRPYFPGYLFVRVDLDEIGISTFQWMTNAIGLVSFGGEPSIVPDALIHAIQSRVIEVNDTIRDLSENFHSGDIIRIQYGPFEGYDAIFDARLPGTERVRVLLKLLSERYIPLEIDASHVEKQSTKR